MADVLINRNSRHIDEADMDALIVALGELGYSAEVDPSTRVHASRPSEWWILYLALGWVGVQTAEVVFQALLAKLAGRVTEHFRSRGKPPPNRINLYGPDGYTVIASVEVPKEEEGGGGDPASGFIGRR
jgi:hypothetical protein